MNTLADVAQKLKALVGNLPPAVLVALALVAPVALLAFKRLQGWWAARKTQQPPASPLAARPAASHRDRLLRVWKQFLGQLSPLLRRSISQFQPFLVLGEAGSGKSRLIDTCTDWKQQERRLLGGSLDDPELRICLGSRVLLLELAAKVLLENSSAGRQALLRLWKPLFRRPPVVVVTLNVAALASNPVDVTRGTADTVRGKLNLLAEVCGKPPEVRVVLTHLDQVKGYEVFSAFLAKQHLGATLPLHSKDWESASHLESALHQRLKDFEQLLPLALTTAPSADYLRMVAFLEKAPPYLTAVAHFLATLGAHNTLLPAPRMERVYLAALHENGEGANPFHAASDARTTRVPNPLWRHRLAAMACASLGALYLLTGYLYERTLWNPARQAVLKYQETATAEGGTAGRKQRREQTNDGERMRRQTIARFLQRREDAPMRYLPRFFSFQDKALEQRLSEGLRERYILPALHEAPGSDEPHRRSLYLLALLYSSRDNALGNRVLANVAHWSEATGLDRESIETYVNNTSVPYEKKPPLSALPPPGGPDASNDTQRWLAFFQQLDKALHQDLPLSSQELASLREEAGRLHAGLQVIQRFAKTRLLLRELVDATGPELKDLYAPALDSVNAPALFGDTLPTVERLLKLVTGETVDGVKGEPLLLSEFNDRLKGLLEGAPPGSGEKTLIIQMPAQGFTHSFQTQRWESLIRDSAAHELVQRFLAPSRSRTSIFFSDSDGGQPKAPRMNETEQDAFLFTGQLAVQGPYTLESFEKYVFSVLAHYTALSARLSPRDRIQLESLITGEVHQYAKRYQKQMERYYQSFGVRAESREALQLLLGQLFEPASPFNELLNTVARNTALRLDDAQVPLAAPMKGVRDRFAPLHNALAEQKPGISGLEPYRALIEQMRQELAAETKAGTEPRAEARPKEEAAAAEAAPLQGLREQLSPVGRMSLAMLRHEKGAYDDILWSWLVKMNLDEGLAGPFMAPLDVVREVGKRELELSVKRIWEERLLASLSDVQRAFPFKPDAQRDVRPQELEALFHPLKGQFHQLFRQYLEPVSLRRPSGWQAIPALVSRVPPGLYSTVNNVERLTSALWDEEGNAQPLRFNVTSVPFKSSVRQGAILTLAYLHSGSDSVLNFNQQPTPRTITVDWTQPRQARLSIETIDPSTGNKAYPPALLSDISPWSMLRLLQRASRTDDTWTWSFSLASNQKGKEDPKVAVQFRLQEDPWSTFVLRHSTAPADATAIDSPP